MLLLILFLWFVREVQEIVCVYFALSNVSTPSKYMALYLVAFVVYFLYF